MFRGQEKLSPERHVEFSRRFGGLYRHVIGAKRCVLAVGPVFCVWGCSEYRWACGQTAEPSDRLVCGDGATVHDMTNRPVEETSHPPTPCTCIGEFRLPGHEEIVVVSNEVDNDGKVLGLNGLDEEASKNGRRHFWHRYVGISRMLFRLQMDWIDSTVACVAAA